MEVMPSAFWRKVCREMDALKETNAYLRGLLQVKNEQLAAIKRIAEVDDVELDSGGDQASGGAPQGAGSPTGAGDPGCKATGGGSLD